MPLIYDTAAAFCSLHMSATVQYGRFLRNYSATHTVQYARNIRYLDPTILLTNTLADSKVISPQTLVIFHFVVCMLIVGFTGEVQLWLGARSATLETGQDSIFIDCF